MDEGRAELGSGTQLSLRVCLERELYHGAGKDMISKRRKHFGVS
jgi:hypothetical protein